MAFWIMLIWVSAVYLLLRYTMSEKILCEDGGYEYRSKSGYALLLFIVPLIIVSLRTDFIDTASYISSFNNMSSDLGNFYKVNSYSKSRLFVGLQMLFKMLISSRATVWLSFVAAFQASLVLKTLKKYSLDLGFSVFMFVATSMVGSWMCNGMRQFIAVSILFACTGWLIRGKWVRCLIIAVFLMGFEPIAAFFYFDDIPWFLGGIHQSVLIFILAIPFVYGKAFNKRLWILAGVLVVLVFTGRLDSLLSSSVETTNYAVDMEYVESDSGTSIFRVLVQAAPLLLAAFAKKEVVSNETPKIICLAVNCSFVSTVLYVASAFTSGIYVGRLPIYFEIYNLILVPWLLSHPYKQNRKLFTMGIMLAYTAYFFYQVNIAWGDAPLITTIPGLGG